MKKLAKYNFETGIVSGYFIKGETYFGNVIDEVTKTIDGHPYIEIDESEQIIGKDMCVIDGVYQEYLKPLNEQLQEVKAAKIAQLKANRNAALEKPFVACKAREWSEDGEPQKDEVYFEFSAKSTGIQLTEPNTIIFGAMLGGVIKYSCTIIEGENRREGYVILNQEVAQSVSLHLTDRGTTYVAYANEKEVEINACATLEQLEAIDITF